MILVALQVLGPDFRVLPALGATAAFLAVWAGLSARDLRPALRAVGARLRR
jgi:hypothetical protein